MLNLTLHIQDVVADYELRQVPAGTGGIGIGWHLLPSNTHEQSDTKLIRDQPTAQPVLPWHFRITLLVPSPVDQNTALIVVLAPHDLHD